MAGAELLRPAVPPPGSLQLQWRPYRFALPQAMVTSQGAWQERCGWLLRLEAADGRLGWGEAVVEPQQRGGLTAAMAPLPAALDRPVLETLLPQLPNPLVCALGMAQIGRASCRERV